MGNTSECEEEKIKGENEENAAVNLTTEANRTSVDQKTCLNKNSYATILKQPIRIVRPTSAPVYVPPQVLT